MLDWLPRFRRPIGAAAACALLATLSSWAFGAYVQTLVDADPSVLATPRPLLLAAGVGGALGVKALMGYVRRRVRIRVAHEVSLTLTEQFLAHLFRLPVARLEQTEFDTDLVSRLQGHREIREAIADVVLHIGLDAVLAVATVCLLATLSAPLTAGVVVAALLLPFGAERLRTALREPEARAFEAGCLTTRRFVDLLLYPRAVRAFGVEAWAADRIVRPAREELTWQDRAARLHALAAAISEFGTSLVLLGVLAGGSVLLGRGTLTAGELMFFFGLVGYVLGPIEALAGIGPALSRASAAWNGMQEVLALAVEERGTAPLPAEGGLALDGVTFGYPGGPTILRDVTVRIAPGETVAIVGESGAGKTTLLALLAGLVRPESGAVRVGGVDLATIAPSDFRRHLGVVFQKTWLFGDTVFTNLALGRPWITEAHVYRALELAAAADLVARLPRGLDTVLVHNDQCLSGGQAQRLGIARALAGEPRFLLLDEATSHLDARTEEAVVRAIDVGRRGRSTVVVAHRLSTILSADRIVVLHGGRIVEEGTHDELVRRRGPYHSLLVRQLGRPVDRRSAA